MEQTQDRFKCATCSQSFNTEQEKKDHERRMHAQSGDSAEQYPQSKRNPGIEGTPSFDRDREANQDRERKKAS